MLLQEDLPEWYSPKKEYDHHFERINKLGKNQQKTIDALENVGAKMQSLEIFSEILPYVHGLISIYLGCGLYSQQKVALGVLSMLGGATKMAEQALHAAGMNLTNAYAPLLHRFQMLSLLTGVYVGLGDPGIKKLQHLKCALTHLFSTEGDYQGVQRITQLRLFKLGKDILGFNLETLETTPHSKDLGPLLKKMGLQLFGATTAHQNINSTQLSLNLENQKKLAKDEERELNKISSLQKARQNTKVGRFGLEYREGSTLSKLLKQINNRG